MALDALWICPPNGRRRIADPTSTLLLPPGEVVTLAPISGRRTALSWIELPSGWHRPDREGGRSDAPPWWTGVPLNPRTFLAARLLTTDPAEAERDDRHLQTVAQVASRVLDGAGGDGGPVLQPSDTVCERVEAIKQLLAEDPGASHPLDDIAQAVYCSKYYLSRQFRTTTGYTIHQYLLQLRLRLAIGLLATNHRNLSSIAFSLGFSSHSHFSAAFKTHFRLTPSEVSAARGSRRRSSILDTLL